MIQRYCRGLFSLSISFFFIILCSPLLAQETGKEQEADAPTLDSLQSQPNDTSSFARQRFLALEKGGANKRIRYYRGSELTFRLKDDPTKYTRSIEGIAKDYLVFNETNIALEEFEAIYLKKRHPFLKTLSSFFIIGGVGYFLIDAVNNSFSPSEETLLISSSLALPGLGLLLTLGGRKVKLGKKRYLKTIIQEY